VREKIEDQIETLLTYQFFPDDAELEILLSQQQEIAPIWSGFEVKKFHGDRKDGGTGKNREEFLRNELKMNHVCSFFKTMALPALQHISSDLDILNKYIEGSCVWHPSYQRQYERFINGFKNRDFMDVIMYGVSYCEGFMGRALDVDGNDSIDKEKEKGTIFHRAMFEELLNILGHYGLSPDEIKVYKLIFLNGGAGWNLRNRVCHGLSSDGSFDIVRATAVLFFFLKIVRIFRISNDQTKERTLAESSS